MLPRAQIIAPNKLLHARTASLVGGMITVGAVHLAATVPVPDRVVALHPAVVVHLPAVVAIHFGTVVALGLATTVAVTVAQGVFVQKRETESVPYFLHSGEISQHMHAKRACVRNIFTHVYTNTHCVHKDTQLNRRTIQMTYITTHIWKTSTRTRTKMLTHTQTQTRTHMHTDTHSRTDTLANTYAHTQTQM